MLSDIWGQVHASTVENYTCCSLVFVAATCGIKSFDSLCPFFGMHSFFVYAQLYQLSL